MMSENITFESQGEILAATIDWNPSRDKPTVLVLHGAHPSSRQRIGYLSKELALAGHTCLRFDFAGHGESTGAKDLSLRHFVNDAINALKLRDPDKKLTVIGSSMGGPLAVEVVRHAPVENIILFSPAAYKKSGYDAPYDERFQHHVDNDSYDAPVFEILRGYRGGFLHMIGDLDERIPFYVAELYKQATLSCARREFVVIPGAPHSLSRWLIEENLAQKERVIARVKAFIA